MLVTYHVAPSLVHSIQHYVAGTIQNSSETISVSADCASKPPQSLVKVLGVRCTNIVGAQINNK